MRQLILGTLVILAACGRAQAPVAPVEHGDVSHAIAAKVEEGEGAAIDLSTLTPFDWTRFCAFHPYTTQDVAEDALGFRWPYEWSNVEHLDDRNYLVFLNGNEVVAALNHSRGEGDFASLRQTCFSRHEAQFVVVQQGQSVNGEPFFALRKQP